MTEELIEIPAEHSGWLNKLINPLLALAKDRSDEVSVEMRKGFYKYCMRSQERCGLIKTIMSRGEKISLEKFYVSPVVKIGKSKLTHDGLTKRLASKKRILITGTAGLGKSVYLKKLTINYSLSSSFPMPIFYELRELNEGKPKIEEAIFRTLNISEDILSKKQFEYALREGIISLFLDAFDEIDNDSRSRYEKEILELSLKFPDAQIVVTSRPSPEENVENWGPFEHAKLQPFDLPKVVELIERLEEDEQEKNKFISLVKTRLFMTHESFLSTPLLALIMFLTYQTGAQIPDKLHEFYHRAFEALYYRHDTQKTYSRKSYTSLNRDQFLRIVSAICAITYFEGNTIFFENDLRRKIEDAKRIEGIDCETQNLLNDLIESICMMQRDGTEIVFTHRSFQEYFTSMYILTSEVSETFKIINQLTYRQGFDNVIKMLGEMNREFIEKKWVLRWLEMYCDRVKNISCNEDFGSYCRFMRYDALVYNRSNGTTFSLSGTSENSGAITAIIQHLYFKEFQVSTYAHQINAEKFEREAISLGRYFIKRDNIQKAKNNTNVVVHDIVVTEKDSEVFKNTELGKYFEGQRQFLLKLKTEIEARHKAKGDGFMSMIRNRGVSSAAS